MERVVFVLATGCAMSVGDPATTGPSVEQDANAVFVVNGHTLSAREQRWMQYVAAHVLPDLPGTSTRRLEIASRVAWWSLKEGIFDTANAPRYSNCNTASGDELIGPLATCGAGRAWQVGLAAVQVPNHTLGELETLAQQLYPSETVAEVLADAAGEAGYSDGSATANAIVGASGSLEKSWLLRRSAIGFVACERNEVVPECIDGDASWCHGSGWDTTRLYAPTRRAAMRAIDDIRVLLGTLAGSPEPPWIGSPCAIDADCGFSTGFCFVPDGRTSGFCSAACEGYCPDELGRATTFCVAAPAGGMCATQAGPLNHDCADLPGAQPTEMDRFIGSSSAPPATAVVCAY